MSDMLYVVLMLGCCAATGGLVVLCGRLMPRDGRPVGSGGAGGRNEGGAR